jgi:hypothetical protein
MDNGLGMNRYPISQKEEWGFFFVREDFDEAEGAELEIDERKKDQIDWIGTRAEDKSHVCLLHQLLSWPT